MKPGIVIMINNPYPSCINYLAAKSKHFNNNGKNQFYSDESITIVKFRMNGAFLKRSNFNDIYSSKVIE